MIRKVIKIINRFNQGSYVVNATQGQNGERITFGKPNSLIKLSDNQQIIKKSVAKSYIEDEKWSHFKPLLDLLNARVCLPNESQSVQLQ